MSDAPPIILAAAPEKNRFRELARASWIAPLIGLLINFVLFIGSGRKTNLVSSLICVVFLGGGLLLGVAALFGIKKNGAKGILIPSLIGIGIPVILTILAVPSLIFIRSHLRPAPPREPAVHFASAHILNDERLHFSMDIPEGFTNFPGQVATNIQYCFARDLSGTGDARLVISVQRLGFILPPNQPLRREDVAQNAPPGAKLDLIQKTWRGFKVGAFAMELSQNGVQLVVYAVQIPLVPSAIQINVGGLSSHRDEVEKLTDEVVASIDGNTNWR